MTPVSQLFVLAAVISLCTTTSGLDAPQAVRLAFAGNNVDMAVSWTTLGLTDTSVVQCVLPPRARGAALFACVPCPAIPT